MIIWVGEIMSALLLVVFAITSKAETEGRQ